MGRPIDISKALFAHLYTTEQEFADLWCGVRLSHLRLLMPTMDPATAKAFVNDDPGSYTTPPLFIAAMRYCPRGNEDEALGVARLILEHGGDVHAFKNCSALFMAGERLSSFGTTVKSTRALCFSVEIESRCNVDYVHVCTHHLSPHPVRLCMYLQPRTASLASPDSCSSTVPPSTRKPRTERGHSGWHVTRTASRASRSSQRPPKCRASPTLTRWQGPTFKGRRRDTLQPNT